MFIFIEMKTIGNSSTVKIGIYGKDDNQEIKNFNSLDEFQRYYDLHADEINQLSTTKLNKMFHIKDYKITRRNLSGEADAEAKTLCFRRLYKSEVSAETTAQPPSEVSAETTAQPAEQMTEILQRLSTCEASIKNITSQLIEIIKAINGA